LEIYAIAESLVQMMMTMPTWRRMPRVRRMPLVRPRLRQRRTPHRQRPAPMVRKGATPLRLVLSAAMATPQVCMVEGL